MGSKKHKKESKKKKHRSRSRSPLEGEERERRRHRKHKDRKKDRSPDVEEVPVDSHLQKKEDNGASHSRSRSASEERDRRVREHHRAHNEGGDNHSLEPERAHERKKERERSQPPAPSAAQESLSIEQTNRLRAKLGLKPLEVTEKPPAEDGKIKDDLGEFYHKPATNIAQQKKTDKIKEKLEERKEKRRFEQKLQTTLLADGSDDDDDPTAWVKKSREIDKQKKEAAKRAAMLDEMDEVFGVSALVAAEEQLGRERSYTATELRGLRVAHDLDANVSDVLCICEPCSKVKRCFQLGEERETVLTLADKDVLAEDKEDVLVNVNLVDDERYKKNLVELKKARAGYQAYDDEADLEAAALGLQRPVLAKYDDEIDEGRAARERGFVIGEEDALEAKRFRDMMRQEVLSGGPNKRLESLQLPAPRPAADYLDEHELHAKFKKFKRKGKIRKRPKNEPIDVDDYEAGAAPLDTDDTEVQPGLLGAALAVDEEETEPDTELQAAVARARRLRQLQEAHDRKPTIPKVEELLGRVKEEEPASEEGGAMVLDATAEFCRTLGDIPTYGLAGNRDRLAEAMDFERDMEAEAGAGAGAEAEAGAGAGAEAEAGAGAWSRVDVASERAAEVGAAGAGGAGLEAEPALGAGVAGALRLALSKGYLERSGPGPAPRPLHDHLLAARHYSIEDKAYGEDDKYGRRERGGGGGHSGPLQEFREKRHFKPNIKLEYVDDEGRPLRPKEAFRYLSHKFHGKGPGKNKQEKRIKKAVQEGLMKKMSSTDTPLGTLQMLQEKQRETRSPYIVLSGNKRDDDN